MSPFYKNIALWLLISLVMIFLFNYFNTAEHTRTKTALSYSQFLDLVKAGKVTKVTLQGEELSGEHADGKSFKSYSPNDPNLIELLQDKKVDISAKPKENSPWYTSLCWASARHRVPDADGYRRGRDRPSSDEGRHPERRCAGAARAGDADGSSRSSS